MDLDLGYTRLIIATAKDNGLLRNQLAYVLATAFWETARTMKPVRETLAETDAQAKARLDNAWRRGKLPWVKSNYWSEGWFGRGFVQITWERNYRKIGDRIGVNLTGEADRALDPAVAAKILVVGMKDGLFTGKKLADYITLRKSDFLRARRIVNGMDKAFEIAEIAKGYDAALISEGYGVTQETAQTGIMAALAALLKGLFK